MTTHVEEGQQSQPSKVFINYYENDGSDAKRLYFDLRAANLDPWIDKENLLPGQNKSHETNNAIEKSDYLFSLFSGNSVQAEGDVQIQIRKALDVLDKYPESKIFFIPARLAKVDIPYEELRKFTYVDLFPEWEEGLKRILMAMKVKTDQIQSVIERQRVNSPYPSSASNTIQESYSSHKAPQPLTFKRAKQFLLADKTTLILL